jgi:hypothetical protein
MKLFAAALAAAAVMCVAAVADPPRQLHVAYAGNTAGRSDSMSVMWHTNGTTTTSTVKFGTQSGAYTSTVAGGERYYGFTYDHVAVLPSLLPSTRYFYIVGDDTAGWSQEFSFESGGALSSSAAPWKFMLYGGESCQGGRGSAHVISIAWLAPCLRVMFADVSWRFLSFPSCPGLF